MKRVTIRVPATTANLGPGFDAFGCALSLYTDVTFEETDSGLEITGCDEAYTGPDNLAYTAYCAVLGTLSEEVRGVKIHIDAHIPICRGLGSSAARASFHITRNRSEKCSSSRLRARMTVTED